ncbi:phosphatidylethanolamine N-methyltransferase [Metschnikowia bicuspidata var. bicuspidata NRRL YB-4993]|uniref:Phosphatidylethanolamine N-methyltransferase n=1 Tax=Metschnikowia bicuspidata var. bicuspidata NRRL YB-4993 TaxID=869754 RepID=A0A1A0HGQ6_9ASCO|nr:phosphatidylethanolamine N-methyltransferase [Metschnikowia bicuspidata var. bicuspidata NRRL YB-4993]OBA23038.1 phosphatidylethanolamine N-methyltransferase [Metschnikowia bicuspidata var. bicuspidata NRRL YB-4993]
MVQPHKGITFTGEHFAVPETHDMVKTLFDPTVRKLMFEGAIVVFLAANLAVFYLFSDAAQRVRIFVALYIFWRLSYNFGIGFLLSQQSKRSRLVKCSQKWGLFSKKSGSLVSRIAKKEVQSQMGPEYDIEKYPVAFNTWLIFRKVVDLILMQDFTTFVCLFVACCTQDNNQFIHGQPAWLTWTRFVVGGVLIVFNFWVKVNAHNTIKDYAWYWGDFFFRQINNEDLIFDGVFEMFPHPMYSVGYIGYYGFALIAKSYTVLTVAIFGHFLQMVFLHYIENPHIDKIYGPSLNESSLMKFIKLKDLTHFENCKPLVGLANFSFLRSSDLINLINVFTYAFLIPVLGSWSAANTGAVGRVLFYLAVLIKSLECVSINVVLILQSKYKFFSKWYLANNVPVEKSLNNFAVLYNLLINLTYAAFFGMNLFEVINWRKVGNVLDVDYFFLRVFLGLLLIFTQVWINTSIVDLIGYFGWFYGDFFVPKSSSMPQRSHLTKAGVYRYLNNPEQVFGVCGVMGLTLMVPTFDNMFICVLWVLNNFIRINFIEKSHMINVYGEREVLQDSGVTKTVKKHLLPESLSKKISQMDSTPLKKRRTSSMFMDSFDTFIKELGTKNNEVELSRKHVAELSQNKYFANSDYHVSISSLQKRNSSIPYAAVGDCLTVNFTAPAGHSSKDWIGLYKITHTSYSRYRTLVSSNNRWQWTGVKEADAIEFRDEKLFWEDGVFEFRYHIDGKHDVVFITEPFELKYTYIDVPVAKEEAAVLEEKLRVNIFSKIGDGFSDSNAPIYSVISKTPDVLETYVRIARLISKSTGLNVNDRFVIYNDNESNNTLTIAALALKLIHIKSALSELAQGEDLAVKKHQ